MSECFRQTNVQYVSVAPLAKLMSACFFKRRNSSLAGSIFRKIKVFLKCKNKKISGGDVKTNFKKLKIYFFLIFF